MSGKPQAGLWTAEEKSVLLRHYSNLSANELALLLPHRSRSSIRKIASNMGLTRPYKRRNPDAANAIEPDNYQRFMRAQDRQFLAALIQSGEEHPR